MIRAAAHPPAATAPYPLDVADDEDLADRVREILAVEPDLTERRMFGGLAFLLAGNMALAANSRGGALVRVDPSTVDALVASTAAEPMEMGGRTVRGWVHVGGPSVRTERQLSAWVARGVTVARSLPPRVR